jgi:alkylation response protein AidB-like acyl-CoA dehydrogenase
VKRFISSAEWDWPENIFHLVLARPVGIEGVGGPGTKGLSLFVVSKHHVDLETGALGERNGVAVTGVEKKMGLKVSTTCEVTFGERAPAVGTLVGGVHDGIAQMFQVIENARMFVGAKAISTLSTGYLNSLEYAKTRVQGADLSRMTDKTAPRVTISHHPGRPADADAAEGVRRGAARTGVLHRLPAGPGRADRRSRARSTRWPCG